jgi:hypothetical protein
MSKQGPAAERLRAFVRERVSPDGALYKWGAGTRLAKAIGVDKGWVSGYIEDPPSSHANHDKTLAICAYFGIAPGDLNKAKIRTPPAPPDPLVAGLDEALKKGAHWRNAAALVNVIRSWVGLPDVAEPPEQSHVGHR